MTPGQAAEGRDMTAEQTAKWIAEHCGCEASDTERIVLNAIRAAVLAEREACAKVAGAWEPEWVLGVEEAFVRQEIATAIRARP